MFTFTAHVNAFFAPRGDAGDAKRAAPKGGPDPRSVRSPPWDTRPLGTHSPLSPLDREDKEIVKAPTPGER